MPDGTELSEFVAWCQQHLTGDEKGQAQTFLDRLFQAFGQPSSLGVGGTAEFRIRKDKEDGGGTAFADFVWKPVVLIEMKKRGERLEKHRGQAERYWTRLVPNRPRYVVLCNFDEFWVYDFDSDLDAPKDKLALADLPECWGPLAFLAPVCRRLHQGGGQSLVPRACCATLVRLPDTCQKASICGRSDDRPERPASTGREAGRVLPVPQSGRKSDSQRGRW